MAYLEEHGDQDFIKCTINEDGLNVDEIIRVTDSRLGISSNRYLITSQTVRLLGSTTASYELKLSKVKKLSARASRELTFSEYLAQIRRLAGGQSALHEYAANVIRTVKLSVDVMDIVAETVSRGPTPYKAPAFNILTNTKVFTTDLTGWTQEIDSGITATTAFYVPSEGYTKVKYQNHAQGGVKISITDSTGTGGARREARGLAVTAGTAYSAEIWQASEFTTNTRSRLRMRWRDSGGSEVSNVQTETTGASTTPALIQLLNQTAPGGAVTVDLEIELYSTGADAVGNIIASLPLIQAGATIEPWVTRIIGGEFKAP